MRWALLLVSLGLVAACASSEEVDEGTKQSPNQQPSGSCIGACGKQAASGCWCDSTCQESGDCCADLATACSSFPTNPSAGGGGGSGGSTSPSGGGGSGALGGFGGNSFGGTSSGGAPSAGVSCAGYCGSSAPGEVCWCDPECVQAGNCCPDYTAVCGGGGLPATGGCTPQACNSDTPASENGIECYCNVACFEYGDCCSNVETVCGI
jgi:hypothetical protein